MSSGLNRITVAGLGTFSLMMGTMVRDVSDTLNRQAAKSRVEDIYSLGERR